MDFITGQTLCSAFFFFPKEKPFDMHADCFLHPPDDYMFIDAISSGFYLYLTLVGVIHNVVKHLTGCICAVVTSHTLSEMKKELVTGMVPSGTVFVSLITVGINYVPFFPQKGT